jgi:hypothetical protein
VLFKHCYYCFVRWTICNLSVCKKVNRQYKHNLSCTLHYHGRPYWRIKVRQPFTVASSPTTLRTDYSPSAFHSNLTGNATIITDDFADRLRPSAFYNSLIGNATIITDDFADGFNPSAFHSSLIGNATIITDDFANGLSPSAFYRGWWKWHNHRRLYRQNPVRQH